MSSFYHKYLQRRNKTGSALCIGLDPDPRMIPDDFFKKEKIKGIEMFLTQIIQATAELTCAYKPNMAFFEALGFDGYSLLDSTITNIRKYSPDCLIIIDAKRSDIGNTAGFYAKSVFDHLDGDAVTLSPYMGMDTFDPFLKYSDKAIIVLCNTSNPGAGWLQNHGDPPLYLKVARELQEHQQKNQIWLVVGATKDTQNIKSIKEVAPDLPLLVPGIGAQGGNIEDVMSVSGPDVLINVGRSILYAGKTTNDTGDKAYAAAKKFSDQIKKYF